MRSISALALVTLLAPSAFAAAPAGTSAPGTNPHAAVTPSAPAQLPNQGKVVSTMNASVYTYVEVSDGSKTQWLAGPTVAVKQGDNIRYSDGTVMSNFYSKTLDRTFPTILFVNSIVVAP